MWWLIVATTAAVAAGSTGSRPAKPLQSYVAKARDFARYRSWARIAVQPHKLRGGPHPSEPQLLYIHPEPPKGATAMPVGTRIVKEPASGKGPVFAMVKRSLTYEREETGGWELFALALSKRDLAAVTDRATPGKVRILWRGVGAPKGAGYDDHDTSCQICHATAYKNDRLLSPPLQLPWQGLPAGSVPAQTPARR